MIFQAPSGNSGSGSLFGNNNTGSSGLFGNHNSSTSAFGSNNTGGSRLGQKFNWNEYYFDKEANLMIKY